MRHLIGMLSIVLCLAAPPAAAMTILTEMIRFRK